MLPEIDYLTVHTPLTDETRNLIGRAEIELMRPTARLVNCARGGIYDEAALAEALKSNKIAGVALDVYVTEPCTDSPLFGLPGVLCTPHFGASTEEAQTQVAVEGVGLLVDFLDDRRGPSRGEYESARPANAGQHARIFERCPSAWLAVVAMGPLGAEALRAALSRRSGRQKHEAAYGRVRRRPAGKCTGRRSQHRQRRAAAARAGHRIGRAIARRSWRVQFADHGGNDHCCGHAPRGRHDSRPNMPRLVQLDDHKLEAFLDGVLLVFTHRDVPGIIGRVGTIFGRQKINIAQMAVGRAGPGGEAIGVLNLDQEPTAEAMAEVSEFIGHQQRHRNPPPRRRPTTGLVAVNKLPQRREGREGSTKRILRRHNPGRSIQMRDKSKEEIERLAAIIVDSVIKVHRAVGQGLMESAYQACLAYELRDRGIDLRCEVMLPIQYGAVQIEAGYRIDMLVSECIIVENKSVQTIVPIHEAQILTYLKLSRCRLGFLIN